MTIPEVQRAMYELAMLWHKPELAALADELSRRKPKKVGPRIANRVTDAIAEQVRQVAQAEPGLRQMDIAARFNISQGRVSEILNGYRS